jgi:FkbM family methyltransferase
VKNLRTGILSSRWARVAKGPVQRSLAALGYELTPLNKPYDAFVLGLIERQGVDVLVDVGANQGQYARRFRDRGFTGRIVSFEPMREAFDRLASEASWDRHWTVRRVALGDRPSTAELHVSANSVSSSLLSVGPRHLRAEPASRHVRTETVQVSTLDNELAGDLSVSRFWLKLDVQGYEKAVLEGASAVLARSRVVQCELSTQELYQGQAPYLEVLATLDAARYSPVYLLPGFADAATGEMLQFDVIVARIDAAL